MKRILKSGAVVLALAAPSLQAQVVNFHAANNGQLSPTSGYFYNQLYVGQGAHSDPGNNIWNGFGKYPGPNSTYFYGAQNAWSGNPGNPYAWYNGTVGTGSVKFGSAGTTPPGTTPAYNVDSAGNYTPITLSLGSYTGDNGLGNVGAQNIQGQAGFLLGEAAVANSAVTFTLQNVPSGSYDLYLYGGNYDKDRGATFVVDGVTKTAVNNHNVAFIEGETYVVYHNISPDGSGNITGTWGVLNNLITGQNGEGDLNGLQLVYVPEPASLALVGLGLGVAGLLLRRRK